MRISKRLQRQLARRPWLWPLSLCLLVGVAQLLALLPTLSIQLAGVQDEGNVLLEANRIVQGGWPYRDFFLRFMPGTPVAVAAWFHLFGVSILAARAYFLVVLTILAMLVQAASWRVFAPAEAGASAAEMRRATTWSVLPSLLFISVGAQSWPMASWHWDADVLALLAILIVAGTPAPRSARSAVGGGMIAGLSVLALQTKGVATVIGLGLALLMERDSWKRRLTNFGLFFLGVLGVALLFVSSLLMNGCLNAFFDDTVRFNLGGYLQLHAVPYDLSVLSADLAVLADYFHRLGTVPFDLWLPRFIEAVAFAAVDLINYGLYFPVLILSMIWTWMTRQREISSSRAVRMTLALGWVAALATAFDAARLNRYHLNFQSPFWDILLVWGLQQAQAGAHRLRWPRLPSFGIRALTVMTVAAFCVNGFFSYIGWLQYRFPVHYPLGTLYCKSQPEALSSQLLSSSVAQALQARPQATVFYFPYSPLQMFLAGHPVAVRFPEAIPVEYNDAFLRRIKDDVERSQTTLLVFSPLDPRSVSEDFSRVSPTEFEQAQQALVEMMTTGYRSLGPGHGFSLFERDAR